MRSLHRISACVVIFIVIILGYVHVQQIQIPDYLPQPAHDYFHADEQLIGGPSGGESTSTHTSKAGETGSSTDTVTALKVSVNGEDTPLEQRLQELLHRPILSYRESLEENAKLCPTKGVNFDRNAVSGNAENWSKISSEQVLQWRQKIVAHFEQDGMKMGRQPYSGRGIVMAAGDSEAVRRVTTSLKLLQSYGCTLNVEVFHFSTELNSMQQKVLSDLSQADGMKVKVRVVAGMERGNDWKSFQIKAVSILQSSFSEILWLDTDSYLLRDPTYLFGSKEWLETGLMLWPDFTKSHASNPLWRLLGQQCRDEYEGESGQMLISRPRHEDLVWLIDYFALHYQEYYGFMGGDRDSFRAAALLLGKKWSGPGRANAAAGVNDAADPNGGGHTMLQADPAGNWTFVHANLIKHTTFMAPLWARIHRLKDDKFVNSTTFGNIAPPNDRLGEGVRLDVAPAPGLRTSMSAFDGYDDSVVVVEAWDAYEELKGFEDRWTAAGGSLG